MHEYKIVKNKIVPKYNRHGKWDDLISQMVPGDAVEVKNYKEFLSLSDALKYKNINSCRRKLGDEYWVWIVK